MKYIYILMLLIAPAITAQMVNTGNLYVAQEATVTVLEDFNNTDTGWLTNNGDIHFYNNWNNDGIINHTENSGFSRFVGNQNQTISGKNTGYLYNVVFNNASAQPAFKLSGHISIKNNSSFQKGIVDNDNNGGSITFEKTSNHTATSDNSHVDGFVIKNGDDPFHYPIGDGGFYRHANISTPNMITDSFRGKYFFEDCDINYPTDHYDYDIEYIDHAEYWKIEPITGDSTPSITISWRAETTPSSILDGSYDDITIVRWNEDLNMWINQGGIVNVNDKTITTSVSDYGVFTLARKYNEIAGEAREEGAKSLSSQNNNITSTFPVPFNVKEAIYIDFIVDVAQDVEYQIYQLTGGSLGAPVKFHAKEGLNTIEISLLNHPNLLSGSSYIVVVKGNKWSESTRIATN